MRAAGAEQGTRSEAAALVLIRMITVLVRLVAMEWWKGELLATFLKNLPPKQQGR